MEIARRVGGEIISVDSMQVYRGLDIGTAKPSSAERTSVPHHGVDVVNLDESFDAARFVALARSAELEIRSRRGVPILCGGTGFYLKALLEGLGQAPPGDQTLRSELDQIPLSELLLELERSDPETYAGIDRKNRRRVVRAVEVFRLTGHPLSAQRGRWPNPEPDFARPTLILGLARTPADLQARIARRVEAMFEAGLVRETEALLGRGLENNRTAMQAIGYRQVVEFLRGQRGADATKELVKVRTRQFAKRQMTWFRHQLPVEWTRVEPDEPPEETAARLITAWERGRSL